MHKYILLLIRLAGKAVMRDALKQAKRAFFLEVKKRREELLAMKQEDALCEIHDELAIALDAVLDERKKAFTEILLLCCLEDPALFTNEPEEMGCILQNGSTDEVNAQHCVYHSLHEKLRTALEHAFEEWHQQENRTHELGTSRCRILLK